VICLNAGNYGSVNLYNISRSSFVTIQSASGQSANIAPQIGASKYIRISNVTLSGFVLVNSCSTNIEFVNSKFIGNTEGMAIDASSCPSTTHNYLVDGVTFANTGQATWEGRLSLRATNGMTIKNSTFSGIWSGSPSDGVQLFGGTQNTTVGPNNVFSGILESLCGTTHCDAIQLYGAGSNNKITGNYFINGDTFIMAPDGTDRVTVNNNVFDGTAASYMDKIQFGSAASPVFKHNTVRNVRVSFDSKVGNSASTNVIAQDNIMVGSNTSWKTSNGSGCSNCTFTHNLFDDSADASGTNNLIGSPTFVGGASPNTFAGFQLTSNSLGSRAATDGTDMGSNYFGGTSSTPAPAPTATPIATATPRPSATPSATPATPSTPAPIPSGETLLGTSTPTSLTNNDGKAYELGMKFTSIKSGRITAIRFYKSPSETGTHTGKIYSSTGSLLASVTFSVETASGWQQQALATPLSITAGTTYVVTVNTGANYYVATVSGLATQKSSANLRTIVGQNGVFGPVGSLPTQSWNDSNYFRDIVFTASTTTTPTATPAPTASATPKPTATATPTGSWVYIATEGQSFTVSGTQLVRYGLAPNWVQKYVTNSGQCTNAFFGRDPSYGNTKRCEVYKP
jgi:hypothetical protein